MNLNIQLNHEARRANGKLPPTIEEIQKRWDYNPVTGIFINKFSNSNRVKIGEVAGSLCGNGYLYLGIGKERYTAQHIAWLYYYEEWPNGVLDHIDGDTTNNAIDNLRVTTKSGNALNNKAKLKEDYGVYWHKQCSKWRIQLYIEGRNKGFGLYLTKEEAIKVAKAKRLEYGV